MFKALLAGIKKFFADDPSDLGAEELVALVLDKQTPEAERKEAAECLGSLSDILGDMSDSTAVANRCFTKLHGLLENSGEPLWLHADAVRGMNEILNVCRHDMDSALLEAGINSLIARADLSIAAELRDPVVLCLSAFDDHVSDEATLRAIEALLVNVRQDSGEIRADSLHSLGCVDSEHTAHLWAEVSTYLDDPDAAVRANTASALQMIGNDSPDTDVLDTLIKLMQSDPNGNVRSDCANALGALGREHAPVVAALSDALRDPEVRHMAIFALLEFEEAAAAAVPELALYLDNEESADSVVMALQAIGTEPARKLLRDNGHDEES